MNLRVRVERLVLEGFPLEPDGRRALGAAVEAELARALSGAGLSAALRAGMAQEQVRGPDIPAASSRPRAFGAQIGRAVGVSLNEPSAKEQRGRT